MKTEKLQIMVHRNKTMMLRSLKRSSPVEFQSLYLENTGYCNRSCSHCFAGNFDNTDMDSDLIKSIVEFSHKNNVFSVIFAGLEPLAKFDTTVAPFITDKKFRDMYFMIHTNGDLLNEGIADVIDKANNTSVQLSLDGMVKNKHDISKGNKSYENTLNAVALLNERNIPYGFFTTCTAKNFTFIKETVQHAIDLEATSLHIVGYKAIGPKASLDFMLNAEQENKRYQFKKATKKEYPYLLLPKRGCNIGINKEGFFSYCPFLLQYAKSEQITAQTSHLEILKMFRKHKEEFSKLLGNTIDCPLIENTKKFVEYVERNNHIVFKDMLNKNSLLYKAAIEIAKKFHS